MANKVEPVLIEPLFNALQQERYVTLATIDYETGSPNISAISWVFAPETNRIFLAIDQRSRIIDNIKKHPAVVLNLIANESTYSINGNAHLKGERLEEVPLKLALIEISIIEVRDVMFYGSKISAEPQYEKTYDEKAASKLDKQVLDALKNHA
ncbi:pyridoxamine 5'-phosphate oxidase family protein [Metabacillus litoralis]|uniref:pyridoxamine 5'-phosphate oxidase family protein n=1 Tax=Metabacillus TaxID=2675233 RepID=UPI000EF602B9|nr:pyridoxamine 5'-phosphate oxidase family protein [Metabacillus litoralis]MCM3160350.1 pyridoxamine 5'-phosphate oxidase family protein [Metabacillus litoralis]MCM3408935.1 pyridoxamine 5'-phosphate oxidase family protein [Metabacillus litoralis]UHA59424.1 pyridoxamine 5'-phosphate oxidase family protein [Metabacillus litoralis]